MAGYLLAGQANRFASVLRAAGVGRHGCRGGAGSTSHAACASWCRPTFHPEYVNEERYHTMTRLNPRAAAGIGIMVVSGFALAGCSGGPTVAPGESGATSEQAGIDTAGIDENLLGPGIVDGVAYGVPMGSNALGLYYNKNILDAAGVNPADIKDWASLNTAIEKVVASGKKGITFSGVAGEEGVFQFEPWFWGAGANLSDLGSAEAIS